MAIFDVLNEKCPSQASLNWGLMVTIGAQINVELIDKTLYKKDFGSKTIFSVKKPIEEGASRHSAAFVHSCAVVEFGIGLYYLNSLSGCVTFQSDDSVSLANSDEIFPGSTWYGMHTFYALCGVVLLESL